MKKKEGGLMRQRKYELENGVAGTMRPVVRKIRFFTLIKLLMRRSCKKNYIAPIERCAKLRESSERRDHGHEKTMDRQGKARDSA